VHILKEVRMCLGTLASYQGGKVPITWQSIALRDAASVEPTIPKLYQS
jgi:hypothetical protein